MSCCPNILYTVDSHKQMLLASAHVDRHCHSSAGHWSPLTQMPQSASVNTISAPMHCQGLKPPNCQKDYGSLWRGGHKYPFITSMAEIMLNITNKSDLKQKVQILWTIFDWAVGHFEHLRGLFWMYMRAVFDLAMGHFGHQCGPFWTQTMGHFGSWPF